MPNSKRYSFKESFTLNNGKSIDIHYGKVGGRIDDDPYPLEQAVADYTIKVLKASGVKARDVLEKEAYDDVGDLIDQSSLLSRSFYVSIPDLLSHCRW